MTAHAIAYGSLSGASGRFADHRPAAPRDASTIAAFDQADLKGKRILVVEDNALIAVDLAYTLRDVGAVVIGPYAHASKALAAVAAADGLAGTFLDGAILDVNLADGSVTPVAAALNDGCVPMIFCTGVRLPAELAALIPDATVFHKPCDTARVTTVLASMIARHEHEGDDA